MNSKVQLSLMGSHVEVVGKAAIAIKVAILAVAVFMLYKFWKKETITISVV